MNELRAKIIRRFLSQKMSFFDRFYIILETSEDKTVKHERSE